MTIQDAELGVKDTGNTEDSMLPLDGGDIHVSQDGPRTAPALALIHGFATSTHSWDPLVPLLTEKYRVIRIDLLGHGRSAKPAGGGYELPRQASRVGAALDQLGVERALIVGHSTGGSVATAVAEQRPDLVCALVLINTGPRLDAFIAPQLAIDPAQWPNLTDDQLRAAMDSAFSRAGYQIPQQLIDDVRGMPFHAFAAAMQASTAYLEQRPLPERLAVLGTPLLVLFGADDRRWRPSSAAEYLAVPGAKVEMLSGVGHSPMLEDPPQTAVPLLAFTAMHTAT
ncbi:alpha/beta fold hydrolase [Nocardia sp. NPDC049149]|uniref:alpha/beta fold hydrolase n=1 Tax=Nocardia sp. NPDC049149 TaxID=3364315 RepID=UPI0037166CA5